MVFVLEGGPRAGQLVDDLPTGYRAQGGVHGASAALFDDVFADVAVWRGDRDTPAGPA